MTYDELMKLIPDEHKTVINGQLCLSEMGVIHLTTLVEQNEPGKANTARRLRYAISDHAAKIRNQSK